MFLRLLKVAFFARQKTHSIPQFYPLRFRQMAQHLLEAIQFEVAQERCYQNYAKLNGNIFTKEAKSSKSWPSSTPTAITSEKKLRSMSHRIKIFHSLVSLKTTYLCFSQSPLCIFTSRSCRFLVLMAENVKNHVLLLSQHCIECGTRV